MLKIKGWDTQMKLLCYEKSNDVEIVELKDMNKTAFVCSECFDPCVLFGPVTTPEVCLLDCDAKFEEVGFNDAVMVLNKVMKGSE